ncbi:YkvA family protein [Mechercharimyces sp. CAU 1602]|uniref:YkvA family protein n=1 Tax=Mechercharimyces sp. CAU 1602 TaxID=2973933 RepID=UPI00216159C6|nr:YkvA family protein [Mechercharimyces sp. CAU 1602]MCS1350186.1 YkvA family protein [Mechercharimyces sp. CAU 1602]
MSKKMKKRIIKKLLLLRKVAGTAQGEQKIMTTFDSKVSKVGGLSTLINKLRVMYAYFRHPDTSKKKKAIVGAALLYFIIPTDVLPDLLPFMGYVDDAAAAVIVWNLLARELDQFTSNGMTNKSTDF